MIVSVAKGLQLKKRLTEKINRTHGDIKEYNKLPSDELPDGHAEKMEKLLELTDTLSGHLVVLKVNLEEACRPIRSLIFELSELKTKIKTEEAIPTKEGREVARWQVGAASDSVSYSVGIKKETIDDRRKIHSKRIDEIQEEIDEFNHTNKVNLPFEMDILD